MALFHQLVGRSLDAAPPHLPPYASSKPRVQLLRTFLQQLHSHDRLVQLVIRVQEQALSHAQGSGLGHVCGEEGEGSGIQVVLQVVRRRLRGRILALKGCAGHKPAPVPWGAQGSDADWPFLVLPVSQCPLLTRTHLTKQPALRFKLRKVRPAVLHHPTIITLSSTEVPSCP